MPGTDADASPSPLIIAVAGSLTCDLIFETDQIPKLGESVACTSFTTAPAGKGANIAVAAHRASHRRPRILNPGSAPDGDHQYSSDGGEPVGPDEVRVFMNGAVGDDADGPALRAGLAAQGIDVAGVAMLAGAQTGRAAIVLDRHAGQASQLGFKGANALFRARDGGRVEWLAGDSGRRPDVLVTHCTLDLDTVKGLLRTARGAGVETVLSASPAVELDAATYALVTHIVFNEHEAARMAGRPVAEFGDLGVAEETAARFVGLGIAFAVITLGEVGAVYATRAGERGHVPAEKDVVVRDTTGAGDSFLGAYIVEYLRQKARGVFDIRKAISFASKAAARTVEHLGAQTSLPWADEIESI